MYAGGPVAGHEVRPERGVLPGRDAVDRVSLSSSGSAPVDEVDQDLLDQLDVGRLERLDLPEPLRRRPGAVVGRVEDVVEPALRFLVPAVAAEVDRDGAAARGRRAPSCRPSTRLGREVQVLDRAGLADQVGRGVAVLGHQLVVELGRA